MYPQILGISGSPIKKSNTDRQVQAVLAASGLKSEFVKLSRINVRPCIACLGCKEDNICKVQDDFPDLAEKVRRAGALVVVGYCPYGSVDAFTKAFLERPFSQLPPARPQSRANWPRWSPRASAGARRGWRRPTPRSPMPRKWKAWRSWGSCRRWATPPAWCAGLARVAV